MAQQNKAFQSFLNLYNFKTLDYKTHRYYTANIISVWERYYPQYGAKSQGDHLTMWPSICWKWYKTLKQKFLKSTIPHSGRQFKRGVLARKISEPWDYLVDKFIRIGHLGSNYRFAYSVLDLWLRFHYKNESLRPGNDRAIFCFGILQELYNTYLLYIKEMNKTYREMEYSIIEAYAPRAVDLYREWFESRESKISPGAYFDIKKLDEKKLDVEAYKWHPRFETYEEMEEYYDWLN